MLVVTDRTYRGSSQETTERIAAMSDHLYMLAISFSLGRNLSGFLASCNLIPSHLGHDLRGRLYRNLRVHPRE